MKKNTIRSLRFLALLALSSIALLAQSANDNAYSNATVTLEVPPLDTEVSAVVPELDAAATSTPFIVNVFTIIGPNSTGLPCFNCVTGAGTPNLGILQPAGIIKRGAAPSQVNVYLWDQNYTGSCTFQIQLLDKTKTVVAFTNPTFSFTAPAPILIGTALAAPSTAAVGVGRIQTIATCGTSVTKSGSPVLISK